MKKENQTTLPETNSSHLKIGLLKRKGSYSSHQFSGANCQFQGGYPSCLVPPKKPDSSFFVLKNLGTVSVADFLTKVHLMNKNIGKRIWIMYPTRNKIDLSFSVADFPLKFYYCSLGKRICKNWAFAKKKEVSFSVHVGYGFADLVAEAPNEWYIGKWQSQLLYLSFPGHIHTHDGSMGRLYFTYINGWFLW